MTLRQRSPRTRHGHRAVGGLSTTRTPNQHRHHEESARQDDIRQPSEDAARRRGWYERMAGVDRLAEVGRRSIRELEDPRHDLAAARRARLAGAGADVEHDAPVELVVHDGDLARSIERRLDADVGTREPELRERVTLELRASRILAVHPHL